MNEFSADFLVMAAGVLVSLFFSYFPGASGWWDTLSADYKRLFMLAVMVVVTGGVIALACAGFAADLGVSASCDRVGIVSILRAFFLALIANQSAYKLTPQGGRDAKAPTAAQIKAK